MLAQKLIIAQNENLKEGTVKKMSDEICRASYYAIEIWEQRQRLGLNDFGIEEIEAILANNDIGVESPEIQQLVRVENVTQKTPLFLVADDNLLYLKAHYLMLRNCGFRVDVATKFHRHLLEKKYDALFIRTATQKFNTWILARYFSLTENRKDNQHVTRIFALIEDEEYTHENGYYFKKQGVDFMLHLPLSLYKLIESFGVRIKMNNHPL